MWLVVGLGNIGQEYDNTRHNIGFRAVDFIISNSPNAQNISKSSFCGELFKSKSTIYLKPSTYMNLSGKSVQAVVNFYKIDRNKIVVIHDDLDLPFGAVRFKLAGGDGGHNGLKSIDSMIGKEYIRCKIGIGKPEHKSAVSNYVLGRFQANEELEMNALLEHIEKSINKVVVDEPFGIIQARYNINPQKDTNKNEN